MPIVPIVLIVGLLLLSVAVNPFHGQAQAEDLEQTSPQMMKNELPHKLGTILFAVGVVVILTAFITLLVYVPLG